MQTLEAVISFSVFMLFTTYVLLQIDDYSGVDDSLYRYQLANDVWRVLYLRGGFEKSVQRRAKLPETLCLERSRELAAERIREMDKLLEAFRRDSFGFF